MGLEIKTNVFQVDSTVVNDQLKQHNYLIESNGVSADRTNTYCVVYFSSNNIYYPNTKEVFKKDIVNKNKFEWYGLRVKKAAKHIFIRDIQKQWYLKGINSEIDSIEKLANFIRKETEGYKIIMLGSSSGGFAASLFGSLLDVEYVISFNGQFQVLDLLKTSSESIDPILFREKDNMNINIYFSIKKYIKKPKKIYYFYSNKSEWDIINKNHIEDLDISIIGFNTRNHGIPFVKSALPFVINASQHSLLKMRGQTYSPLLFSFKHGGFLPTLNILYKKMKQIVLSKITLSKKND
jgi:hypothetical protein